MQDERHFFNRIIVETGEVHFTCLSMYPYCVLRPPYSASPLTELQYHVITRNPQQRCRLCTAFPLKFDLVKFDYYWIRIKINAGSPTQERILKSIQRRPQQTDSGRLRTPPYFTRSLSSYEWPLWQKYPAQAGYFCVCRDICLLHNSHDFQFET